MHQVQLLIEQVPLPTLKPGQVLIKMAAAPINPSDYGDSSNHNSTQQQPQQHTAATTSAQQQQYCTAANTSTQQQTLAHSSKL